MSESMLTNQRYFPIYDGEGKLTREFVVVSNSKPENAERVIDGNERVVRARLDDAKFFYEEDLKISLRTNCLYLIFCIRRIHGRYCKF